jgi:drug/metabolite transporter (DMT)-like permease
MTSIPPSTTSDLRARLTGAGLCAASAFGFSTLAILAKLAYAEGLSMTAFLSLRFAGAALLLLIALGVRRGRAAVPEPRLLLALFLLGAVGYFAQASLYFLSLQRLSASLASVLLYIYPAFVALTVWVVEGRRPTRREGLAMALALTGAALTAGPLEGVAAGRPDPVGIVLSVTSAAGYAVYIVVSNRYVHRAGPLVSTAWLSVGSALSFGLAGWLTRSWVFPFTPRSLTLLATLVLFSTIMPITAFFAGMRRVGPTAAALLSALEPVFTISLAAIILHEALTRNQWAGGALILIAVVLLSLPVRRSTA